MSSVYYTNAAAALVVFDLTHEGSFEAAEKWRNDIEQKIRSDDPIPIVLVGNKVSALQLLYSRTSVI